MTIARDRKHLAIPETWFRVPMVVLSDRRPAPGEPRTGLELALWHAEVVTALCELNLVGFRTPECAGNFEVCCARAGRRRPPIEVFPEADEPVLLHRLASAEPDEPRRVLAG